MLLNTPIKLGKPGPGDHVLDQLAAYLDYELPEPARAAVREHLRRCPQCENELATLRAAKQLLRDLPAVVPTRSFKLNPDQVAALNARPMSPVRAFGLPRLALALRLASAACCLLLLTLIGTSSLAESTYRAGAPLMTQNRAPAEAVIPTFLAPTAEAGAATPTAAMAAAMGGTNPVYAAATATAAPAALAGSSAYATAVPAAGAASAAPPSSPVPAADASAQIASSAPNATESAAQNGAAFNGSRIQGSTPTTPVDALVPIPKMPALATITGDQARGATIPPPVPGAARTQQLAPPAPAEPPSLLPWEIGLAAAALVLALISIPFARRAP